MQTPDISADGAGQKLADAVVGSSPVNCEPLNISPWLAMSLLQKAVRRGRVDLAQLAARSLLHGDPARLWRRCAGIAFEDIGFADIAAVRMVTAAVTGKRFRAQIGGDWKVASFIVSRMVVAPKCRSADDLLMSCEVHPSLQNARLDFPKLSTSELLAISTGPAPILERALALWFALGTNRWNSRHLIARRGDPSLVFELLREVAGGDAAEIALAGFRRGAGPLAPFVALLTSLRGSGPETTADDEFPPETVVGDVPGWSYDLYSREGRAALQAFLNSDCATATWLRIRVPTNKRLKVLGALLFRVEGGKVRRRLLWPTGSALRQMMDFECYGPYCQDANAILQLLHADIPESKFVRRANSELCISQGMERWLGLRRND